MILEAKIITRSELEALEDCFDDLLMPNFEKESDVYGGHDISTDTWSGAYRFEYVFGSQIVKGNFNRTTEHTYEGNLVVQLTDPLKTAVVPLVSKASPSLRELLSKSSADEINYQGK